jgi:hypothetical protein
LKTQYFLLSLQNMSFNSLPTEIYRNIFQHLPKKTLLQCRLICKSFYERSTDAAFNTLTLTYQNQNDILNISQLAYLGEKIRTLIFLDDCSFKKNDSIYECLLQSLYESFRYLKTIDLSQIPINGKHLKLLKDMASNLPLVERILVTWRYTPTFSEEYLQLSLEFKKTLTYIKLYECDDAFFGGKSQNILNFLKNFINLRSLTISRTSYSPSDDICSIINLNIIDILRSCPRLASLSMDSLYQYHDASSSSISLEDDTLQKSNIESLSLSLPEFKHPSIIRYISQHTTANLTCLNL